MKFLNGEEVIKYTNKSSIPLHSIALQYEEEKTGKSKDEIIKYLYTVLDVMKNAIKEGITDDDNNIKGKIIGNDSIRLKERYEKEKTVCGKTMAIALSYALSMMEVNASMGKVVACPTAGSCGVLPSVLISVQERFSFSDEEVIRSFLVANMIGTLVAKNATISGAEGGCQAEVGTASAMAAGAVTYMMGGTVNQVFNAAAMCFKNLLGLVCDPIAGLVESPCAKRNGIGAANALICAEMSLAGIESIIPFDEVVEAMYKVGRILPPSLKETSMGGLAITKTAIKIQKGIFEDN